MTKNSRKSATWGGKIKPEKILIYAILGLIFIIMFYPFFYVLFLSVMPYENYIRQPVHLLPSGFTAIYFQEIFAEPGLMRGFQISILKTIIGGTLSVIVTTMAGYALSRKQLKYRGLLTFLFLIPMYFNGGIIPFYLTVQAVGIRGSFWAMILPFLVGPFWIYLTRSYYMDYPDEVIEAAIMDGAGHFQIFWRIIFPTSTPLIATLALMYGTAQWNEYFWARILVPPDLWPATAHLYNVMNTRAILQGLGLGVQLTEQSFIAAVAAMLIIPILLIYPFLQRFIVKGIMVGSVKG